MSYGIIKSIHDQASKFKLLQINKEFKDQICEEAKITSKKKLPNVAFDNKRNGKQNETHADYDCFITSQRLISLHRWKVNFK